MANIPLAGDSAEAGRLQFGVRSDGSIRLPGNKTFRSASALVKYLRANPGYAYKHRLFLNTIADGRYFKLAGYNVSKDGRKMQQFENTPGQGGRMLRAWTDDEHEAQILNRRPDGIKAIVTKPVNDSPLAVDLKSNVPAAPPGTTPQTRMAGAAPQTHMAGAGKTGRSAPPATAGAPAAGPGGPSGMTPAMQRQIMGGLLGIKLPNLKMLPENMVNMLGDPYSEDLLSSLAGTDEIDSSISQLKSMVRQNESDTTSRLGDIDRWYGQVQGSLATAASRDKAIDAASLASIKDVATGVASAIGGAANPGSGMAAQAGAQGADLIAAMGNAQEEYNSDIAPLIQAEAVGQKAETSRESARRESELNLQIGDMRSSRGSAMADARMKLAELNRGLDAQRFESLLGIRQANMESSQQDFANRMGLSNARQAAALAAANFGLDVDQFNTGTALTVAGLGADAAAARGKARADRNKPPSPSSLREADRAATQSVNALRETGQLDGAKSLPAAINAVKSAFGITPQSNRALRAAAYRSAARILPGARIDRRWFGLG